ncbi:MAG: hypothetical protein WCQ59_09150 [Candidatus Cloacimonadaceae bacterium]
MKNKKLVALYVRINGVEKSWMDPVVAKRKGLSINQEFHQVLGLKSSGGGR